MPAGSTKTKSPTTAPSGRRKSSSPTAAAKKLSAKEQAAQEAAKKAAKAATRGKKNASTAAQSSSPSPEDTSSGSPLPKKKKKQQQSSSLEDELAKTKALLAAEKARRRKAELQLPSGSAPTAIAPDNDNSRKWRPINRPGGSAGDDWSLQTVMRLQDRDKRYFAIRREVKRCVDMSGLDHRVYMNQQNREKLGMVCMMAREHQPYLARFTDDWATIEFIRMLFKNRRQQDKIRAAEAAKAKAAQRGRKNGSAGDEESDEESDEDDDEEDSQAGSDGDD